MKINLIDLKERYKLEKKQLNRIINNILKSGNLILSKENDELENSVNKYLKTKYCLTLNSGTDALLMALWTMGIKKGDEVITSPISFIATAAAIHHVGAKPVFVDVKDDLNIDETKIEKAITKKTKAIIPVHWTGKMCNMKKIWNVANKHKIFVIEDAAQAIGSRLDNYLPGKFSHIATFSTHPLKVLNAIGDGGFIVTNFKKYYDKIKKNRNHGMVARDDFEFFGLNSRMDAINAGVVKYRLGLVNKIIKKRNTNINYLEKKIKTDHFKITSLKKNEISSQTMFVARAFNRDKLQKFLIKNNIQSLIYYGTPLHLHKASKFLGYRRGDFPIAEKICDSVISVPFHQYLKKKELDYIAKKINEFYGQE